MANAITTLFRRAMLGVLATRWGRGSALVGVRYRSANGDLIEFPVQGARAGDSALDIAVGDAAHKSWWRHFARPAAAEVLVDGRWRRATGMLVAPGPAEAEARSRYARRFPRAPIDPATTRMVHVELAPVTAPYGGVQS